MKKGISEKKVQRMRNIVTGNYTKKTSVQSGVTKQHLARVEGDVWEEKGKQWTVKNGIRRTVDRLSTARALYNVPLSCPKCSHKMIHPAFKAMYKRWGMCFNCVTKWENEMRANGTYDTFIKEFDETNFNAWLTDVKTEYDAWLKSRNSQSYVTEAGDIEDWSGGKTTEQLQDEFNTKIAEIQESRNEKK